MLRDTFDGLVDPRQAHRDDHAALHRAHNVCVYADDYASVAAALAAASTNNVPRVLLNPTTAYALTETLPIPAGVVLDGGGRGPSADNGAKLTTTQPLDPMVSLSNYAAVVGCNFNGGSVAAGGVFGYETIGASVERCGFVALTTYGVKFGGALYITLKRNYFAPSVAGYAIDALQAYGAAYYGINVGVSEGNLIYAQGGIRLEGILTSIADDFEGSVGTDPVVVVGGAVQSQLVMLTPYFELTAGTAPIVAIRANGSAKLTVIGAQAFGDLQDAQAQFLFCNTPQLVAVQECSISRFGTAFAGSPANNAHLAIFGNAYGSVGTINGMSNLANVSSALCVWPGDRIGVPSP